VKRSEAGYSAAELTEALHVETKHTLVELFRRDRLGRELFEGSYVYFGINRREQAKQRRMRRQRLTSPRLLVANPELAVEEAKAEILLFLAGLNERQRRLYAGLESLKVGVGGDEHIAGIFGMDRHTVARGREELMESTEPLEGVRRVGAGRPSGKKTPEIFSHLQEIMKETTAGDPVSGIKWSRKSTYRIARHLTRMGIKVSAGTVGRLLKAQGYSLRKNRKNIETPTGKAPDPQRRDRQFHYIGRQRYPHAEEILIVADGGGSNGYRTRLWKQQLQEQFCNRVGIKVRVCHFPPGASRWNPIERRLFSHISANWAAQPLESYETILKFIRTTRTGTDLGVRARISRKKYQKGIRVSDQMQQIQIKQARVNPEWNYIIEPAIIVKLFLRTS